MRFFVALALLLTAIGPAEAALGVCNRGAHPVKVAVGLFNGTRWASRGWWHVAPKQCLQLLPGGLSGRYYYMYATDGAAGTWDGSKNFCIASADHFDIVGRGGCSERGYDRHGFFEIDTGNRTDFTQMLSD